MDKLDKALKAVKWFSEQMPSIDAEEKVRDIREGLLQINHENEQWREKCEYACKVAKEIFNDYFQLHNRLACAHQGNVSLVVNPPLQGCETFRCYFIPVLPTDNFFQKLELKV